MRRIHLLPILIGIIGAAFLLLVVNRDSGETFGIANDAFASTVALSAWATVLAAGIAGSGRLREIARNLTIWLFAVIALTTVYVYRYELQEAGARLTAGLIPGLPITRTAVNGATEVMLHKSRNGHFETSAMVDGRRIRFLIDTGASAVVLTYRDAMAIGIDPDTLSFTQTVSTANGKTSAAVTDLGSISLGPITRTDLHASVSAPGQLGESLLGMNFLETLTSFRMSRDVLVLRD